MGSLVAAYVFGLLAIAGYVGWLAVGHARLSRRLDELETMRRLSLRERARDLSRAA